MDASATTGILQTFAQADALGRAVALLLLAMSVASWVVIVWKAWLLRRARTDLHLSTAAFWQAADLDDAQRRLHGFDPHRLVLPLLQAARSLDGAAPHTLAAAGDLSLSWVRRVVHLAAGTTGYAAWLRPCWAGWAA